jgi:hypothetical protein
MLCFRRFRNININLSSRLITVVSVVACAMSIQFIDSGLVTAASALTIALSFVLLVQQRKTKRLGNLLQQNNELRRKAYFMRQERERLHRTLDRMDEHVADLHGIPQELHRLSKNRNIDRLLDVVAEQKELQEKLRRKINQQVMQQILAIVVREDRDQNWTLRPLEVEKLIVRLGLVEGIEFNEQRFRQMLTQDPTVSSIMKILRSLLERDDEYQHGSPIFKIKT